MLPEKDGCVSICLRLEDGYLQASEETKSIITLTLNIQPPQHISVVPAPCPVLFRFGSFWKSAHMSDSSLLFACWCTQTNTSGSRDPGKHKSLMPFTPAHRRGCRAKQWEDEWFPARGGSPLAKGFTIEKGQQRESPCKYNFRISNPLEDNTDKDSIAVWLLLTRLRRRIMEKPESPSVKDHV